MNLHSLKINESWTLFLDRDGVINRRIVGDYVKKWEEMELLPGVPAAFEIFNRVFGRIIVVSNQQGVGKGLMTMKDVENIHETMAENISRAGGRIDAIYFAPQLASEKSIQRKPGVGMALKARKQFPEIKFKYSLMAGDSLSDMIFGKRAGMKTIFISDNLKIARQFPQLVDHIEKDLFSFAKTLITGI